MYGLERTDLEFEESLKMKEFQKDLHFKSAEGKEYPFQFWNPGKNILVEVYPQKSQEQIRISPEYDQLYFLVELHIKLIHREFPGLKIKEAFAVGAFSDRAKEYAKVHGGMKILTHDEALKWLTQLP